MVKNENCYIFRLRSMSAMNEERKNIINILRSIINISKRRGKTIRELENDFLETAGYTIPTFEYSRLEDFLGASGEFIIKNYKKNESIIYHKPKKASQHIAKFIQENNISKRRISVVNLQQPDRQSRSVSSFKKMNDTPPKVTVAPKSRKDLETIEYTFEQLQQKENRSEKSRFDGNAAAGDLTLNKSGERDIPRNTTTNQHNNPFMKKSPKKLISPELQKDTKQVTTQASNPTNTQETPPILNPCFDVRLPRPNVQSSLESSKMQFSKNVSVNYEGKSLRQTHSMIDLASDLASDLANESDFNRSVSTFFLNYNDEVECTN